MKKFLLGALATVALSVSLASCSSEEPVPVPSVPNNPAEIPSVTTNDELVTVNFDASVPKGVHSRSTSGAWPEWTPADGPLNLEVGVYSSGTLVMQENYPNVSMSSPYSVKLNLAKEGSYRVVFVAYTSGAEAGYFVDWDNATISYQEKKGSLTWGLNQYYCSKQVVFVYDEPVTIKPADQSSYAITLRRPTAEVVVLSDFYKNPVATGFNIGTLSRFGTSYNPTNKSYAVNNVYNFLSGKTQAESGIVSHYSSMDAAALNGNTALIFPGYTEHKVLYRGQFFVDRTTGTTTHPGLQLGNYMGQFFFNGTLPEITYKPNTRYVYVDDSGNPGGGETLFTTPTTFSMDIDAEYSSDNSFNL